MFSYIPNTPTLNRSFTPKNIKGIESEAIDTEREKIRLLELAKTSLMNKAIKRNIIANKNYALKTTAEVNDQILLKLQTAKTNKPKAVPKYTADFRGQAFVVLSVHGAYVTIFDTSKNVVFNEHQNNISFYPNGKINKLLLDQYDISNILATNNPKCLPQNKGDLFHPSLSGVILLKKVTITLLSTTLHLSNRLNQNTLSIQP